MRIFRVKGSQVVIWKVQIRTLKVKQTKKLLICLNNHQSWDKTMVEKRSSSKWLIFKATMVLLVNMKEWMEKVHMDIFHLNQREGLARSQQSALSQKDSTIMDRRGCHLLIRQGLYHLMEWTIKCWIKVIKIFIKDKLINLVLTTGNSRKTWLIGDELLIKDYKTITETSLIKLIKKGRVLTR